MRIAVGSDDGSVIAAHVGRARGFVIFELAHGEPIRYAYRRNTFSAHARGLANAGHAHDRHGPLLEALADCDVLIAQGMGHRFYSDLTQHGKEVFITNESDVDRAVTLYTRGKLVHHPERACRHTHHG